MTFVWGFDLLLGWHPVSFFTVWVWLFFGLLAAIRFWGGKVNRLSYLFLQGTAFPGRSFV
jgi:hypothetical protein